MPPRYAVVALLGKGGGGEVWAVRDRVSRRDLALKVLAEDAGEAEAMALVREAVTLSGLEGLGVPQVVAFGRLPGSTRRYLVRELVPGRSLEEVLASSGDAGDWLVPLAEAAQQLTVLHRAGLLHGDIKPANVIVGPDRAATLVDLGLATPYREGGARARGLTPKYAAPELFRGEALTVRAEVYALGATLREALAQRDGDIPSDTHAALLRIAARATEHEPAARFPSVDELGSALEAAARIAPRTPAVAAWPVLGTDGAAQALADAARALPRGEALAIVGPRRSGRTTLAQRLSWSLGVHGTPVVFVEPSPAAAELVEELEAGAVLVVDDLAAIDADAGARIARALAEGARLVAVGTEADVAKLARARAFVVAPLDEASATEIMRRAIPSLPDRLLGHLLARTERRPGELRGFVRRLAGRPVTSADEIDAVLDARSTPLPSTALSRDELRTEVARALATGRFDAARTALDALGKPADAPEAVAFAIAAARIALARGDGASARTALDGVEASAARSTSLREWQVARARTAMRLGDSTEAARLAAAAVAEGSERDATTADALAVNGLALAFLGEEDRARLVLAEAIALAKEVRDPRIEAVALVSAAIAYQRSGRPREARDAYEAALVAAERAHDAWTLASTRLNLATLAKMDGDLAQAIAHSEAALDMGRRAGGLVAVQQALFNLANLDLYLGRYARASASIEKLAGQRDDLSPVARAQLVGLEAELAMRLGDTERAARLYERCAEVYEATGRPLDGAEARLEGILGRLGNEPDLVLASALGRELEELRERLGDGGFGEHEALAGIVRGSLAIARGDETAARAALDEAHALAAAASRHEWAWRALDARARLAAAQGASALARRDTDASLALLEETAAKLPRDLREVFWNDPRRRALRQAHTATMPARASQTLSPPLPSLTGPRELRPRELTINSSITSLGTPMPGEDRLSRIFEITRDLARERDLDRLLQRVTDHAIGLVGAERGLVVIVDDAGEVVAHTARGGKGEEAHKSFSRSVAERVIRDGEPVIATSARDDARLAEAVSIHQLMIQSIACVPILGAPPAGKMIGALYLETRLRPGIRFRDELPTLAAFADQAAIAIESARLVDELRRTNTALEAAQVKLTERLDVRTEQLASARRDLRQARAELRGHFGYAGLVGTSAPMRKTYALIDRIKDTDVPVLVTGESGTGKEVIAKAIHLSGPRAKMPFLGVNCGAIPANLLESELFGHVRGAFTGADRDRKGLFRECEDGTLLLDEIGEMPLKMQAGLLRVLQEKTVRPIGGAREEPCNARIVAATNRDLQQMVAEGTFREDLYYRLNVIELKVPALRERADDLPALLDHFLGLFAARHKRPRKTLTRDAIRKLQAHDWPGNVRQLENVLLNAWLLSEEDEIVSADLDLPVPSVRSATSSVPRPSASVVRPRSQDEHRDVEKEKILGALEKSGWNRVQAAKLAGIPRRTFYRRLKDYGIV